jgi:hypothetical protein
MLHGINGGGGGLKIAPRFLARSFATAGRCLRVLSSSMWQNSTKAALPRAGETGIHPFPSEFSLARKFHAERRGAVLFSREAYIMGTTLPQQLKNVNH